MVRRRYRHVLAGMLVFAVMLGLLAAAIHRFGNPATVVVVVVGATPLAIADAVSPR